MDSNGISNGQLLAMDGPARTERIRALNGRVRTTLIHLAALGAQREFETASRHRARGRDRQARALDVQGQQHLALIVELSSQ